MVSSNPLPRLAEPNKKQLFFCDLQANNVSAKLQSFYESNELTDIILVSEVDNFKIPAHRNVLAASSDYFRAMFRSVMKEAKADEVSLGEIDGATLKLVLDFMYRSSIELCSETFTSVFKAANFLQMSTLIGACCEFMADGLDAGNCLGFALIADQHNYSDFVKKACTFAAENFKEVSQGEEFLTLNDEQLSKIISSDHLQITEEDLFLCLTTWFAYDKQNRIKGINNLLPHVRFAFLSPQFIIKNRHLLCLECYETICCWLEWHLLPEKRKDMAEVNTQPRLILAKMALLSGDITADLELHVYDSSQNTWECERLPVAPILKEDFKAEVLDKKLIIVGGCLDERVLRNVECYDLQKKNWRNLPSMRTARCLPGVAVIGDDLYVVGGCEKDRENWQRCVEKFSFTTRKWQDVASMNTSFEFVKVAVLNGCLYASGDFTGIVECYDPAKDEWTRKPTRTRSSYEDFELVSVDGLLYAVGGVDRNNISCSTIECYDPTKNIWLPGNRVRPGSRYLKCAGVNNRLLAFTKSSSISALIFIEEYNRDMDQWKNLGQYSTNLDFKTNVFTL